MILRTLALAAVAVALSGCGILSGAIPAPEVILTTSDNNCSSGARAARNLDVDQALATIEWCEARDRATAVRIKPQGVLQRLVGAVVP